MTPQEHFGTIPKKMSETACYFVAASAFRDRRLSSDNTRNSAFALGCCTRAVRQMSALGHKRTSHRIGWMSPLYTRKRTLVGCDKMVVQSSLVAAGFGVMRCSKKSADESQ
jgi:hypothetical protein